MKLALAQVGLITATYVAVVNLCVVVQYGPLARLCAKLLVRLVWGGGFARLLCLLLPARLQKIDSAGLWQSGNSAVWPKKQAVWGAYAPLFC